MSCFGSGPLGFLSLFDPSRLQGPVSLVRSLYTDFGQISDCCLSEKCVQISDVADLKQLVADRIAAAYQAQVWTPVDFLDLGSRDAVDKALQRLVSGGRLRRIDRGLYDTPRINRLTKRPAVADYRQIVDALARRDQVRMLVDGLTAANDLGLTTAVPSKVVIHTDARRRAIQLDNLTIEFKRTAPSKLYWAGRPAMRIVQALHWLKDTLPTDRDRIVARLSSVLADHRYGKALRGDLRTGLPTLPAWMQDVVRELLSKDRDHPIPPSRTRRARAQAKPPARKIAASRAS
jgi:hypothetical protein